MPSKPGSIQSIELDLFIEAVARRHGLDFRNYARASLRRRVVGLAHKLGCASIAELLPRVLHDDELLPEILTGLSVPVTRMFRDPPVFRAMVETLRGAALPSLTVWQAGCATGEEVYSLAILLEEAGLLRNTRIFATDINGTALAKAEAGVFPARMIDDNGEAYAQAGGTGDLASYFSRERGAVTVAAALSDHITFFHHNLVSDRGFCAANLVVCRNVLIYFDRQLQDRVLGLLEASLLEGGFLCLGSKENIVFSAVAPRFAVMDAALRLYRKRAGSA